MTVLAVCQAVALKVGLARPDAVLGATDRDSQKLGALANEVAERIAFDCGHDWTLLKTIETVTGDGSTEAFDLPSDYRRMIKRASLWPSDQPLTPLDPISDYNEWLGLDIQDYEPFPGFWVIAGGQIHIKPAIANAATVKYIYLSNLIVAPDSGDNKTEFTADTDTFRLNERVLRLGMIWQWNADHGKAYAEDMENYEMALAEQSGGDRGSLIFAERRPIGTFSTHRTAYPKSLGS